MKTNTTEATEGSESNTKDLLDADALQAVANKICKHTPDDFEISLHIDSDNAYVSLWCIKQQNNHVVGVIELPDNTDKSLLEQLNDAVCVANGFSI